ncbi:hypothetical protein CVIRNUC_010087 [Coccomyxa viridis]|uniref:NmrA-like domain-containing protein n=1 Tax=Coccomyxa viridis TaxID=1274662 RepID=A0AAV1IHP8_9CHLO|nr:hypothetical protein CVIRNUC_010087 [Coccomyxa viridis]
MIRKGGAVVDALLTDERKQYKVRAISRNSSSSKAKALADRGVEVAEGDLSDKASLVKAFTGADSAFIVTDFHSAKTPEREIQQGRNAIDAAKEAGVKFVVFSTLEDLPQDVKSALPKLDDGYTVPHFEAKANIKEYLEQSGVPHACLLTSIFFENFLEGMGPRKQEDGSAAFSTNLGTAPHAWHSVIDIGGSAAEILADPTKYDGKTIPVNSGYITNDECAKVYSAVTGEEVRYHEITDEQMASFPFPIAKELANMFAYYKRFPYYDQLREPTNCIFKGPSFSEWAKQNVDALKAKAQG